MDAISQAVWHLRLQDVNVTQTQFSAIISSDLMTKTFWSLAQCNPFAMPLWRAGRQPGPIEGWSDIGASITPPAIRIAVRGRYPSLSPSGFRFVASPMMNLEREIHDLFCCSEHDEIELATPTASPLVVGVQFTVRDVTDENRLKLEHFRAFEPQQYGMEVRFNECSGKKQRGRTYPTLAIVKFRQSSDGMDSIQVYDRYRRPNMPASKAAYAGPDWDVSQFNNEQAFFVLYERQE
ncbi:hypothetical protein PWT90_09382 [Aphanocladium album]|nr:hypothetical protein PWT90_09382 [Aphanocladium album]